MKTYSGKKLIQLIVSFNIIFVEMMKNLSIHPTHTFHA